MPRGPSPAWTARAPHTSEAMPYIAAAFQVGYDTELVWNGIETKTRAADLKRGLFNAARGHKPEVSVHAEIEPASNGDWQIRFAVHDKKAARAYVVAKHGADRKQWPYNARQRSK